MDKEERKKDILNKINEAKDKDFTVEKIEMSKEGMDQLQNSIKVRIKYIH